MPPFSKAAPNLFLLHDQFNPFTVAASLIFISNFAFTLSALECRPPLAVTARHAGWIICNILLNQSIPAIEARRAFRKLKPLAALKAEKRRSSLDLLSAPLPQQIRFEPC
jgi:hypothetical protein